MHISIRPAVRDDAEAIARLNAALDDLRATPEHIAAHLRDRGAFERGFVAEADGIVDGWRQSEVEEWSRSVFAHVSATTSTA